MKEIYKKIRDYEIRIRKAINTQHFAGDHYSVFKGQGLEFDDVRQYQYGDDIRSIHWKVSAKGHGTFVKTFKEEKEQFVYLILDVSASQEIGRHNRKKIDLGKELCGVLALTAAKQSSQVGLLCFSGKRELYIRPEKGENHAYQIISSLYKLKPEDKSTRLDKALSFSLNMIKRKSIVIIISDFIDTDYEKHFIAMAKKHDLIVLHIGDRQETFLPSLGIVPVVDKESGKIRWINSSTGGLKNKLNTQFSSIRNQLSSTCLKYQIDYLQLLTDEDIVKPLVLFFNRRNRVMKRS